MALGQYYTSCESQGIDMYDAVSKKWAIAVFADSDSPREESECCEFPGPSRNSA